MYLASVDPMSGQLVRLRMIPMQLRQLRPHRASRRDAEWLCGALDRETRRLGTGTRLELEGDGALVLRWA